VSVSPLTKRLAIDISRNKEKVRTDLSMGTSSEELDVNFLFE
jgi:hypothetical protein